MRVLLCMQNTQKYISIFIQPRIKTKRVCDWRTAKAHGEGLRSLLLPPEAPLEQRVARISDTAVLVMQLAEVVRLLDEVAPRH